MDYPPIAVRAFGLERQARSAYAGITQTTSTNQANFLGVITPSDMHFERHHAGIPQIDPKRYKLLIHGLVERPMAFTLEDLKRLPQVSFMHFVECSGNSSGHWGGLRETATVLDTHPIYSNSEWIGVPLEILFREVGARPQAHWFLAESYDGAAEAQLPGFAGTPVQLVGLWPFTPDCGLA